MWRGLSAKERLKKPDWLRNEGASMRWREPSSSVMSMLGVGSFPFSGAIEAAILRDSREVERSVGDIRKRMDLY